VGFGSSDIVVRRIFPLSPNHLQADVSISRNASLSNPDVSVISGFQVATAPAGFQITALVAGQPNPVPILENALPGLTGAYPGAVVSLYGSSLALSSVAPLVTIGGQPITVLYASPTQLNLQLPTTLTPGPATLTLNNGAVAAFPVIVYIDTLPAGINAIQNVFGGYIDATHPVHENDYIIVTLSNFAPPGSTIDLSRIQVSVGGVAHPAIQIAQAGTTWQVGFHMNSNDPVGQEPLIVYLDGRSSYQATVTVAN
jgi:uncharacterized protein (TIGR03437 family)